MKSKCTKAIYMTEMFQKQTIDPPINSSGSQVLDSSVVKVYILANKKYNHFSNL